VKPPLLAQRFLIEGRVQGVAYRASAQRQATQLGLTGWVRNTAEGAVEAYAVGTPEQLASFADWLWQGPRLARVTAVSIAAAPLASLPTFSVRA
jgi:acylphosphatase